MVIIMQSRGDHDHNNNKTNDDDTTANPSAPAGLAEEERLREKLRKRRRTDDPSDHPVDFTHGKRRDPEGVPPSPQVLAEEMPIHNSHPSTGSMAVSSSNRDRRPSDAHQSQGARGTSHDRSGRSPRDTGHRAPSRGRRGEPFPEDHGNRGHGPAPSHRPYYPPHHERRGGPPPHAQWERGGPSRYHYDERGGPPPPRNFQGGRGGPQWRADGGPYDSVPPEYRVRSPVDYRREGRRGRNRSRSRSSTGSESGNSRSRSRSKERSRSRSVGHNGDSRLSDRSENRPSRSHRSGSRSSKSSGHRSRRSRSPSTSLSRSSSSSEGKNLRGIDEVDSPFSKDQRTVFVSQLVMRTQERDIRRYFRKKVGCVVREVILLRDKRTGNHKGCAYVQFGRIEDVNKAVSISGQPPDFQRFPILVKPSEAEKNYTIVASSSVVTASMMGKATAAATTKPLMSADGKLIEAQKVYIGSLDPSVSDEHIFALFSQFGQLEKVSLQMDPTTKTSRGFAFLSYRHPEEANLAIQTMSNQVLAGRAIKTGWASQTSTVQGVEIVTSDKFPPDAAERARKAMVVLAKMSGASDAAIANAAISTIAERALDIAMTGTHPLANKSGAVPTVADARAHLAADRSSGVVNVPPAVKLIGGEENPTKNVLVHNMFDKDQESGDDWPIEIKEDFEEECSKFGTITNITVMSKEPGGKIYASFETIEAAAQCAKNLAGRWFDKRQLRVDFMRDDQMPNDEV